MIHVVHFHRSGGFAFTHKGEFFCELTREGVQELRALPEGLRPAFYPTPYTTLKDFLRRDRKAVPNGSIPKG